LNTTAHKILDETLQGALAELQQKSGDNLTAVLFFGSRLVNSTPDRHSASDWFIVVREYRRFYRDHKEWFSYPPGFVAWLNRRMPPNVIHIPCPDSAGVKAIVINEADMEKAMGRDAEDHFCRGRLSQSIEIIQHRDDATLRRVRDWLAQSRRLGLEWIPLYCAPEFGLLDYCTAMIQASYSSEIRPETGNRVAEVVAGQREGLTKIYTPILEYGVTSGRLMRNDGKFRLAAPASEDDKSHWDKYFRRTKRRATARWAKYVLTFSGWPDYIARKLERRSGIKVEITDRERRWPLILLWPKAIRTFIALRKSKKVAAP
jgi:hypothetical protein